MKMTWTWKGEDEGEAVFLQRGKEFCRIFVYVTAEDAAELVLKLSAAAEPASQGKAFLSDVEGCFAALAAALRKEGLTECSFLSEEGSQGAGLFHALADAGVVQKAYSEFLLKKELSEELQKQQKLQEEPQIQQGKPNLLDISGTAEGVFLCTAADGLFSCKLRCYQDGYYVYEVLVREGMRGRGIGTAAMSELLARLGELPQTAAGTLYLQVGSYNEPAMRLYRRLGFEIETELCYYSYVPCNRGQTALCGVRMGR